jgi:hypothetical protein
METNLNLFDTIGLKRLVKEATLEAIQEHDLNSGIVTPKLFSIAAVSKILQRSHKTITKLVKTGAIKTTPDGLISESALNNYLGKE